MKLVLQAFFAWGKKGDSERTGEDLTFSPYLQGEMAGVPLWKPDGKPVYNWSKDMMTCLDERWALFGPFKDDAAVAQAYLALASYGNVRGYRIINEHCVISMFCGPICSEGKKEYGGRLRPWPRAWWADG